MVYFSMLFNMALSTNLVFSGAAPCTSDDHFTGKMCAGIEEASSFLQMSKKPTGSVEDELPLPREMEQKMTTKIAQRKKKEEEKQKEITESRIERLAEADGVSMDEVVTKDESRIQRMHDFLTYVAHSLSDISQSQAPSGKVNASLQRKFEDIFENNDWESAESRSGSGSTVAATVGIRRCLDYWMTKYNVTFLLDIPCGDGNWQGLIPGIASRAVMYQGYDISPGAVAKAKSHNIANENMRFGVLDLVNQVPTEQADMVMIKEVIQHLPLAMGLKMLQHAKAAGIKWLALTSNPLYHNIEIQPGDWFPGPNAQAPPFNFGAAAGRCGNPGETGGVNDFMLFDLDAWQGF